MPKVSVFERKEEKKLLKESREIEKAAMKELRIKHSQFKHVAVSDSVLKTFD